METQIINFNQLVKQSLTKGFEYILTAKEEKQAINHAVNQQRIRKFRSLTDKGLGKMEATIKINEITEADINRAEVLETCNRNKWRQVEESEKREKDIQDEISRFKALKIKCDANYHFNLIKQTYLSENKRELIYNQFTKPLIQTVCFFLSQDPRFETELKFDLTKGLLLQGVSGLGKTSIIKAARKSEINPIKIESMIDIFERVHDEGDYVITVSNEKIIYLDDVGT